MELSLFVGLVHRTSPWYVAVPLVVALFGFRFWRMRRGGGRGPFRRGPFGGPGNTA